MEKENQEGQFRSLVNYNFGGANIRNFFVNNAPSTYNEGSVQNSVSHYGAADVAQALAAISGPGRPLDQKRKWAAVYWLLRWQCNYPVDLRLFCQRISELPQAQQLPVACDYNNMRAWATLGFMNQDARRMDEVKPSRQDEQVFCQCREVVLALQQALDDTRRQQQEQQKMVV